jgi:basic amino acid/polyamine antiporter, APA family
MAGDPMSIPAAKAPTLFIRQSTGLVRELGTLDVVLYNSGAVVIGPVLVFVMAYWYSAFPDANVLAALWISLIPVLSLYIVYALLTAAMPRAGGDYVFIGRILHPAVGFAANWTMVIWNIIAFGVWGTYTVTLGIAPGLASIGLVTGSKSLTDAAQSLATNPTAAFITGTALVLILAVILTRGLRVTKTYWNIAVTVGIVGLIVGMLPLLFSDQASFKSAFDKAAGAGAFASVLASGRASGVLPLPPVALGATLLAVAMAASGISGATWSTYTAGELKQGRSVFRQLATMIIPLGLMMVFWTLIPLLVDKVAGHDFVIALNAASAGGTSPLKGVGFPLPFHVVFGSILSGNAVIATIIAIGNVAWFLALMPAFVMMFIRCLFAWSFDGLMPRFLADVDTRTGVPLKATVFVLILGELGILLWSYFPGIFSVQVAYFVAVFFFTFSIAGITAMVFPYLRPQMYAASPIAGYKLLGLPLISVAGFVAFVFSLYVGWVNLTVPVLGVSTDIQRLMPVIIMAAGFVVYYVAVWIRRAQGSNIELVYKEIPPD